MTKSIVFRSARVFDGESEALRIGVNVFWGNLRLAIRKKKIDKEPKRVHAPS